MQDLNFKIAVIQSSLSRNAGGLFNSVKNSMKYISSKKIIKVFSIKDNFSEFDIESWKPLNTCLLKNDGNNKFKFSFKLYNEIINFNPKLIHVHGLWEFPTLIAYKLKKEKAIPYIISPRGMLDKWALNNSKYKKKIVSFLYEKRNLKNAICIHALCESEYESIRAFGLKNPVAIIPNSIQVQPKSTINNKVKNDKKRLLFLGRIHPKKGIELLIEAINMLKDDDFTKKWEIVIAGWDENNHLKKLTELTNKYNLKSIIKFIGPIYGQEKHNLLSSVDAFILPSFSEGLPMSILEAFSYGLPVLMTKECNIPEAFKHHSAIEIETNIENISQNLRRLNKLSEEELLSISNNGYDFVHLYFSWETVSEKMISMYNWIVENKEIPNFVRIN
jgi:poly(glycerol-phosphate) alpha-glucosyltransferase